MSSTWSQTSVLSDSARRILLTAGEHISYRGGWQTIRSVALSDSKASDPEASVEVPQFLESAEAMEFLGFTPKAALDILQRFQDASTFIEDDCILEYAKGHVRSVPDVGCPEDDWTSAMVAMGITQTLCQQILDPRFTDLRLTQNARFWVLDTIKSKFDFLLALDNIILESTPSDQGPMSLQARLERSKKSSGLKSKFWENEAEKRPEPQLECSVTQQSILDTEFLLLKGGDCGRLNRVIRLNTDSKNVNRIENALNIPPGDFTGSKAALYFTTQRQAAYHYAEYAKARLHTSGQDPIAVGVLHIVIPKELMAGSVDVQGDAWKGYVWSHRLQRTTPDHLRWLDKGPIVVGPVAKCSEKTFVRMVRSHKDYKALEPVKMSEGEMISQCCIREESLCRRINERGRFWLEKLL